MKTRKFRIVLICCAAIFLPSSAFAQCYDIDTGELLVPGSEVTAGDFAIAGAVTCGCKTPKAPEGCTVAATTSNCTQHSDGQNCTGQCNFQQTCNDPQDNATITKDCKPRTRPTPAPTPGEDPQGTGNEQQQVAN